jgi:hypothetical protein
MQSRSSRVLWSPNQQCWFNSHPQIRYLSASSSGKLSGSHFGEDAHMDDPTTRNILAAGAAAAAMTAMPRARRRRALQERSTSPLETGQCLLATRAGFNDAAYMRDQLGRVAAYFTHEQARTSTALVDTATENWVLRTVDGGWDALRRGQDYYDEGALIWLSADALIRTQSQGHVSLDDFLRNFLGQRDTGPRVVPYTREDVEAALSATWPFDWHKFFEERVY